MAKHQKILERAAAGQLPREVREGSDVPVGIFRELYEQGLVAAVDAGSYDGLAYIEPRITIAGREYLNELQQRTFQASPLGKAQRWSAGFVGWIAGILTTVSAQRLAVQFGLNG